MSGIYERELLLGSEHVNLHRRLRTSVLFELLQTAAIRHTEQLGMGRDKTLDRGLLWVVTRQVVQITRMPVYDERITLRSWPGEMQRLIFPRYCEILSQKGETLVRASAVWMLMDSATRSAAFPDEYGVFIAGADREEQAPLIVPIQPVETAQRFDFTVPYSYVDLLGHMNNTHYFDLVENLIPAAAEGRQLQEILAEYKHEARFGDTLHIAWGEENGRYYVNGGGEKPCFRMSLQYRKE